MDDLAQSMDPDALPLSTPSLASLIGMDSAIMSAVGTISTSPVGSMGDLRTDLEGQGFTVEYAADLGTLPAGAQAELLRVSRTYPVLGLSAETPLSSTGLGDIADLSGVGLSGTLRATADGYVTLRFGVDTGGFYLAPGAALHVPMNITGEVTASAVGGIADIQGSADLGLTPVVSFVASHSDGRVRLAELGADFASSRSRHIEGGAGIGLGFEAPLPAGSALEFEGRWLWELAEDGTGFALDVGNSGFDKEGLADAIGELVDAGRNS